ncbi:NAD-dependent epimerase/dehydratase family protein [Williamsia sterculiae]|uniref:UDP-glucose 4-epimerase n=1 Tax=Williamsia sterculiae TaxID=1344003 RepID=A0A1N7CWG5_9NOCA|nr:NAD-dependent epimerase/dehydratase family protein [Williamsia sterculiae]SIR67815.1 UDP-glucose 4-epimerase [Williamsia sterculiae]
MTNTGEPPEVVLVTGASTFLGGYLVTRLAQDARIRRVLAVDSRPPSKDMLRRMGRAEFVRADIRRPVVASIIEQSQVDTVVHAATSVMDSVGHSPAIKEFDVIGGMQVCAAAQRAPSVRRFVLRSTGMVYGASADSPAHFSEDYRPRNEPRSGYGRDLLDIEGYARGMARRRTDMTVTILRPTSLLGPRISTRMSTYLSSPVVPMSLGYEPRLQFLHEEDALAAMEHATFAGRAGTFNIAGDGVVTLTQAVRRCGGIPLPVPSPLLTPVAGVFRNLRVANMYGDQSRYLTYGRVLDTARMRSELGFAPRYSSIGTLDDFIARRSLDPVLPPETWVRLEKRIDEATRGLV